ncbi:MAG: hypothetical protein A2Y14_00155 [Verrucomicrobia bacterium GWF2_51_19]|nr:MAG: hypothetical protein A2Y14_00155 [Verrucomicrobia bacterium GWF2_51_19]HCJ11659.1 hypothetical protein [Opitutae bacterium]
MGEIDFLEVKFDTKGSRLFMKKHPPLTNQEIDRKYAYWRFRLTYSLILGYAAFQLVRQNFNIALPYMTKDPALGSDIKMKLGVAMAIYTFTYGVGKFVVGMLCDRLGARWAMPIGLLGSSACSLVIAFSKDLSLTIGLAPLAIIGTMYAFNSPFQSAGWPPVARSLTQWFGPKKLGTRWGLVNSSHQIGSITILIGGAILVKNYGWQSAFIVPAIVCSLLAFFLFERVRDNPESMGLPPVEVYDGVKVDKIKEEAGHETITFRQIFRNHLLFNAPLWYTCTANFFVYFVRMGFFLWAPTMICEMRGTTIVDAGIRTAVLEAVGALGGIAVGWMTDRFFAGRRSLCAVYMMIGLAASIALFRWMPVTDPWISSDMVVKAAPWMKHAGLYWITFVIDALTDPDMMMWGLMGFFVYGPQTLTGLSSAEFGSKRAAAAACGLNGTIGYTGASFVSFGAPWMAKHWGWEGALSAYVAAALLGAFFLGMAARSTARRSKKSL